MLVLANICTTFLVKINSECVLPAFVREPPSERSPRQSIGMCVEPSGGRAGYRGQGGGGRGGCVIRARKHWVQAAGPHTTLCGHGHVAPDLRDSPGANVVLPPLSRVPARTLAVRMQHGWLRALGRRAVGLRRRGCATRKMRFCSQGCH